MEKTWSFEKIGLEKSDIHRKKLACINLHKALVQLHPQGADSTIKRNCDLAAAAAAAANLPDSRKGGIIYPKHSKLNKIKRQRNVQQMEEDGKNSQDQTIEEEIGNPPKKEE